MALTKPEDQTQGDPHGGGRSTPNRPASATPSSSSPRMVLRSACKGRASPVTPAVVDDSETSGMARHERVVHHHQSVIESRRTEHVQQQSSHHHRQHQLQEHLHNHSYDHQEEHQHHHRETIILNTGAGERRNGSTAETVRSGQTITIESPNRSHTWNEVSSDVCAVKVLTNLSRTSESGIKTDYTYSQSYHKLSPDALCPPNMSRYGLSLRSNSSASHAANGLLDTVHEESSTNGGQYRINQNTSIVGNRNGIYNQRSSSVLNGSPALATNMQTSWNGGEDMLYGMDSDSDDEHQYIKTTTTRTESSQHRSWISSFLFKYFDTVICRLGNVCSRLMWYVYWIVSYSLLLETWLLMRDTRGSKGRQSSWSWWLILIPLLLLLLGYWSLSQGGVADELLANPITSMPILGSFPIYTTKDLPTLNTLDPSSSLLLGFSVVAGFLERMQSAFGAYFVSQRTAATEEISASGYQSDDVGAVGAGHKMTTGTAGGGVRMDQSELQSFIRMAVREEALVNQSPELQAFIRKMVLEEVNTLSSRLTVDRQDDVARLQVSQDSRLSSLHEKIALNARSVVDLKSDLHLVKLELEKHKATTSDDGSELRFQKMEELLFGLQDKLDHLELEQTRLLGNFRNCCKNHTEYALFVEEHVISVLNKMSDSDKDASQSPFLGFRQWLLSLQESSGRVDLGDIDSWAKKISAIIVNDIQADVQSMAKSTASQTIAEHDAGFSSSVSRGEAEVSERVVRAIVRDALALYAADKVGKTDFALESSGGSVISTRCSETYYLKTAQLSVLGFPLWYTSNTARIVIQPSVYPGECWAFKGSEGYLVIQLSVPVKPTGFTLEHIPRSLSPKGRIDSAPKEFNVFGLVNEQDPEPKLLGRFTYLDDNEPLQQFTVTEPNDCAFPMVELRILSNHGNPDFTCLYRFRVHGVLLPA